MHGVRGVIFHQRYVLVRRSVDDDVGPHVTDEPLHLRPVGDVCQVDADVAATLASPMPGRELSLHQVQRTLRTIHEEEAAWSDGEDLTGQLGPDRAAAAGDHHRPVADQFLYPGSALGDHRATQQVLDPDPSNAMSVGRAIEEVRQGRHGTYLEVELERGLEHLAHGTSRGIGHRDQDGLGSGLGRSMLHGGQAPEYPFAGHDLADEPGVVVKEPNWMEAGPWIAFGGPRNADAGLSGAIQQCWLPVDVRPAREAIGVVVGRTDREPSPANDGRAEERFDYPERPRKPTPGLGADQERPIEEKRACDRAEQDGNGDSLEVGNARESPSTAIQAEADIGDGPHRQQENDREGCGRDPDRTREPIQAERKREVCGEGDPDKIEGEQKAPSNEPREQQW